MRISGKTAVLLFILNAHAWAAKPAGTAKGKPAHARASSMDGNDPVETEKSDLGPFARKGQPTALKQEGTREEQASNVASTLPEQSEPRAKIAVFGNVVIGFGHAPEPGPSTASATGKAAGATFIAGGRYDVSPQLTLGLRIAWSIAAVRQVDGSRPSTGALGAPELMAQYRVTLSARTLLPVDFGVGIPVAQGDYDTVTGQDAYRQTQVNDFADASSGYRDPELFAPKRLPIVAAVGITHEKQELELHAKAKLVLGLKVGGQEGRPLDNTGTYDLEQVTFRSVTSAGLAYRFLDKPMLAGALDSWIAYNAVNAEEFSSTSGAAGPTRFQLVFEPRLVARFGKLSPSIGYLFPIGGRLADSSTSGLELHCDVAF